MTQVVPATTRVRRAKVANMCTSRLLRRRAWLTRKLYFQSRQFATRMDFAHRAAELHAINSELVRRGVLKRSTP